MTNAQFLEKIRGVLLTHSPIMKTSPPPQVPEAHISTRDSPHEQSKSSAVGTHDNPLAARGQRSSLEDSAMAPDKGGDTGHSNKTYLFITGSQPNEEKVSVRSRCRVWLEARLSDGPVPLAIVLNEAKNLGFSAKAIRLARSHLNVRPLACLTLTVEEK